MVNYKPHKLIEYVRDGLVEQEHYGFILKISAQNDFIELGESKNYPFYLRSCAKPLQASLIIDGEIDRLFALSEQELALSCASHAGEPFHTQIGREYLRKIGFDEKKLLCGLHKPINKAEQHKLIISGESENVFQNNCLGKHIMMLALCKKNNWDIKNYPDINHPLQQEIKKKIYNLCELKDEYPITKDGCGVPIHSMPLKNMAKGYLNLFLNPDYEKIKLAFLNNPMIIGGSQRLDTAIMLANKDLIAKVGAGGICIVVNLLKKESLIVKISDCDMKARAIVLIEALKQLKWLDECMLEAESIKEQNSRDILTLHNEKIGEIKIAFSLIDN